MMKVLFTTGLAVLFMVVVFSCTTGAVLDPAEKIVTVISSDGCANTSRAIALVDDYARKIGLDISFDRIVIQTDDDVQTHKFLGSPTVRIRGLDVDPDARSSTQFGFT